MPKTLLLVLPALQEVLSEEFRQIKYSLFPPLSLLTIAALTPPERYRIIVRDEHVESASVAEPVDLVAMTVYISSAQRAYEFAAEHRRRGARVVLGGIHPTTMPEEAARHADAVCIGPAETVWPQILRDFERGGLQPFYHAERRGSALLAPIPRRDLMNSRKYLVRNTMVTSRGCPHSCRFCYKSSFWGQHFYESRPISEIERELDTLAGRFVFFLDDNFLADRRRNRRLFPILRDRRMVWQAGGSLDAAREPGYLDEAYDAGCRSLFVGFESITASNLLSSHKQVNTSIDYVEAIRQFHDAGIMINGSFVFGFDDDRPEVFERTVEFAIENRIETATFHILTPFPGTSTFDQLETEGRLLHRDWSRYDSRHAVFRPRHMTPEQLEEGYWWAYREFYSWSSILYRAAGLPGRLKRIAYNVAWKKLDPLWAILIHSGLLPAVRPVFERALARPTRRMMGPQRPGDRPRRPEKALTLQR